MLVLTKFSFWEEVQALGNNSINFWDFLNIFQFLEILSLNSFGSSWGMFITNNHDSFHLWWKESLLNHQKVSKYFEHVRAQNLLSPFMSFWRTLIVNNSDILAEICFISLKNVLRETWKSFNTKFGPLWKVRGIRYQLRQTLMPFCKLVALILC